ncbi:arylsulfatase I-like [Anneissia japonica]|uniref:arylsulfatase I-like n=1 Tax=Anneissia japonica TaxID=1529436 RepID=UPI00142596BA|nr:arylsulfatase I-like [Anneissia japonica]
MSAYNLIALTLAVYASSCYVTFSLAATPKPHVIFILSDDQGYRDVGYHGSIFATPVIDRLAGEGVKLENYYVQPICTPTRSQLMTGRYQIRTGLQHGIIEDDHTRCLPLDEVTIAEKMKEANYTTHMVGKWHLGFYEDGCIPTNRGFDTFLGYLTGSEDYYHHDKSTGYDFRRNDAVEYNYKGIYSTFVYAKEAIDIISKHDPDKPMFLYISLQAVHTPLQVPSDYTLPYVDTIKNKNRRVYAGMVTCMDEAIGNITGAIKANGDMYDNTVIIFSSDNGGARQNEGNNWPLRGFKSTYFEGGIRTIGFVHSPLLNDHVKGTVSHELIHVSDWLPTLVEGIAGWTTKGTKPLDGVNQWDTIRTGIASARTEILHNIDPLQKLTDVQRSNWRGHPFDVRIQAAIRFGHMKLITGNKGTNGWIAPPDTGLTSRNHVKYSGQIVWLFNITADPEERNDLTNTEPDVVIDLLDKLASYEKEALPVDYPPGDAVNSNPKTNGNGDVWGPWKWRIQKEAQQKETKTKQKKTKQKQDKLNKIRTLNHIKEQEDLTFYRAYDSGLLKSNNPIVTYLKSEIIPPYYIIIFFFLLALIYTKLNLKCISRIF